MQEPLETAELMAFARTVDAKSLSRAAVELGMPRATISRRLARLEERLGARLLRRTTRSLVLTDAGQALYRHARLVLEAVQNAEASVRSTDGAVRGELRVSVPPMMDMSFARMLNAFVKKHPDVRLQVHSSTAYVDLVRGGYDVALRASTSLEPGLVARTLRRDPIILVASPSYLEKNGTPRTRKDLRNHKCLTGFARGELPQTHWPLSDGSKWAVDGAFSTNDIRLLCEAAIAGLGIAFLPGIVVFDALERGSLVQVLRGIVQSEARLSIVYAEREFVPPQMRAFIDAVVVWAEENFVGELPESCKESSREAAKPSFDASSRGRGASRKKR